MRKLGLLFKHHRAVRALLASHLSLLEGDGVADMLGGLSSKEEEGVLQAVNLAIGGLEDSGERVIVEFGTLFGLTAQLLAENTPASVRVVAVDNFCWNPFGLPAVLHEQFTRRILRPYLESGKIQLEVQDSADFRGGYAGVVPNMVFIDADHSYQAVKAEIEWAQQMGVAVISGHDYGNELFDVTRAVDAAFPQGVKTQGMVWWSQGIGVNDSLD